MLTIHSVDGVRTGDVLHHPAFGFAVVDRLDANGAELRWENQGANHPLHASAAVLAACYRRCEPEGFFAQTVHDPAAARQRIHADPLTSLALLLWELDGPQRLDDVRDWLAARRLVPPERFDAWWGPLRAVVAGDARFVATADTVGLAPGQTLDQLVARRAAPLPAPGTLPPAAAFGFALRLARRIAAVHGHGETVVPDRQKITIAGDDVLVETTVGGAREEDVRFAARLVLDQCAGPLPPPSSLPGTGLPPLVRRVCPEFPPELLAVLTEALADEPALRPPDGLALWERLHAAEAARALRGVIGVLPGAHASAGFDTHIGLLKALQGQTNQDSMLLVGDPWLSLLCVFDGISQCTVGSGDLASALCSRAVRTIWVDRAAHLRADDPDAPRRLLIEALGHANDMVCSAVRRLAGPELDRCVPMGSTAVCALTRGNRVHIASLGDSRVYVVGRHGAALLTTDQNVLSERLRAFRAGHAVEWGAHGHALVGFCGHFDEDATPSLPAPFTCSFDLLPDEWLVLCSDGFTDYAAAEEAGICRLLSATVEEVRRSTSIPSVSGMAMELCRRLVDAANRGGGGDNVTVLALTLSSEYGTPGADRPVPSPG